MHYYVQAPQFDRWSGNSQGRSDSFKFRQSPSGRGSHNLQLPIHEDNPLSPGYSEPLCVSQLCVASSVPKQIHQHKHTKITVSADINVVELV